jgi:hypothetical protein
MRRTLSAAFLALLAACASGSSTSDGGAPPAVASAPGDPNDILPGTWQVVYEADGSPRQFTLVVASDGAGGYTGTATGDTPMGFRIRRISKNGNGMVIDASTDADLVNIRVSGNANQMRGNFTVGRRPMGVVMSKIP